MKKIILGLVAATAIAAPIAMSAPANAATTTAPSNSTVFLSKSALQGTLHLNNAGFDALKASDFKATGTLLAVQDVHFTCNDVEVSHYDWPTAYADAVTATPVWNGGHNQITGYNVTENYMAGEPAVRNPINWVQVNDAWDAAVHSPCGDVTGSATSTYRYETTPLDVVVNGTSVVTFQHA
jgi:hypothetical protein